ncbi:DUF4845 domain-containing protein [Pseudomonas sp. Gutcm_11s]|uniref:DUF4845 domain-containing protein n=1 Tax=Pseudomonas sp. Gutcm_11s TaxID=3026088 RepID=UPI00235EF364|nr:DUF4845 domain-containing protein [Pseudomonas sp. Gutcm_11s]MDD0842787.1 DUF4845 domain-containing protein [Pseudomonas sp. Gutcm_11s]
MRFARSQKGMSLLGWIVTLAVLAFLASTAFKLFPHYMDYYALQKIITKTESEPAQIRSVRDFYDHIQKGMGVNSIRLNLKEALEIKQENDLFLLHLKYEKREHLIENLDLVATFDKEFRIRPQ